MKKLTLLFFFALGAAALLASTPTESKEIEAPEAVEQAVIITVAPTVVTTPVVAPTEEIVPTAEGRDETPTPSPTPTAMPQPSPTPTPTEIPYKVNSNGMVVVEAVCSLSSYDPALCLVEAGIEDPPQWMLDLGYDKDSANFDSNCNAATLASWKVTAAEEIRRIYENYYGKTAACPSEISLIYNEELEYSEYTGTELQIDGVGQRSCFETGGDVTILGTILNDDGEEVPHIVLDLLHDYYSSPPPFWHEDHSCTVEMTPQQFEIAKPRLGLD